MLDRLIREFQGTCSDAAIQVNPYIQLIPRVVMGCADPCVLLSVIVPALHARLATPVIVETSEEIRLLLLVRTTELVGMCEDKSSPYIQELSEIVQRTLHDPFPDETCKLINTLAGMIPRAFSYVSPNITKDLLHVVTHKHSAVRISGISALASTINSDVKALDDDVIKVLWNLVDDKSPGVRKALYETVAGWQIGLDDRYSIAYKYLPILLAGCADEMPHLSQLSSDAVDAAGKLYETEWPDRVKAELDTIPLSGEVEGEKARVGVRHLFRDNTLKIVKSLVDGAGDWNAERRCVSTKCIGILVGFVRGYVTGYIGGILDAVCRICAAGDEVRIVDAARGVGRELGKYVGPGAWLDHMMDVVQKSGTAPQLLVGSLVILESLLEGTSGTVFCGEGEFVKMVVERFLEGDLAGMCWSGVYGVGNENVLVCNQVSGCMLQVVKMVKEVGGTDEGYLMFCTLVRLQCVEGNDLIPEWVSNEKKCGEALGVFKEVLGYEEVSCVYDGFVDRIVRDVFLKSASSCNASSIELREMQIVVKGCGRYIGKNLDRLNLCIDLFIILAERSTDINVRDRLMQLVLYLVGNAAGTVDSAGCLKDVSGVLLQSLVFPPAIWKAGRVEASVRALAIECILHLVTSAEKKDGYIGHVPLAFLYFKQCENAPGVVGDGDDTVLRKLLIPILVGSMDEEDVAVRVCTLKVLDGIVGFKLCYQEVIKRFDDSNDSVRIYAAGVLTTLITACFAWEAGPHEPETEVRLDDVHWEAIVKCAGVHMDDMNADVQESMVGVLVAVGKGRAEVVKEEMGRVGEMHRGREFIKRVMETLK